MLEEIKSIDELSDDELDAVAGGKASDQELVTLVCQGCGKRKKFTRERAEKKNYIYKCDGCR